MAKTPKAHKGAAGKVRRDLMADAAAGEHARAIMTIVTPEGVSLPFERASFGERVGALLIDLILIVIAPVLVALVLWALPLDGVFKGKNDTLASILLMIGLAFFFFIRSGYFMAFEMGRRAATPGKRIMKLRVIAHDGGRLTPAAIFTRNALREVEMFLPLTLVASFMVQRSWFAWLAAFWALGLVLLPLFNREQARLGDFLAGTRVVHMPKAALGYDLAETEMDRRDGLVFSPEQLAYGEMELQVLEQVLRERKPGVMQAVAARIKARIQWVEPVDPPLDEAFLRAYYAALRAHLEGRMLLGKRRRDKNDPALP
jgi:uncharacterized RDD family membrane protein YckC